MQLFQATIFTAAHVGGFVKQEIVILAGSHEQAGEILAKEANNVSASSAYLWAAHDEGPVMWLGPEVAPARHLTAGEFTQWAERVEAEEDGDVAVALATKIL